MTHKTSQRRFIPGVGDGHDRVILAKIIVLAHDFFPGTCDRAMCESGEAKGVCQIS